MLEFGPMIVTLLSDDNCWVNAPHIEVPDRMSIRCRVQLSLSNIGIRLMIHSSSSCAPAASGRPDLTSKHAFVP